MRRRPRAPFALAGLLLALACGAPRDGASGAARPRATRGYVLISIDTLRADALGLYGSPRPTTPFLDGLAAARATVFENAYATIPATLPSHMSMFTGLYPSQHDVFPPAGVLAAAIPTLPELLHRAGYRTFGHTEGGYMSGTHGFARGFDEWTDTKYAADSDIERTFARGVASLGRVAPGERFFLFLHTYSVHDPYDPPARYRDLFWQGPPPAGAFPPTGSNFVAYNQGRRQAPPELARYYRALYDAGVRYLDDTLAHFFAELERLGLADDTTVVLTADHGEEFLEHGRYVHSQPYPECLHVPLLVVHPDARRGRRVGRIAQTIDLLPTLADLAGFAPPSDLPGHSLAPLLADGRGGELAGRAYAQDAIGAYRVRTVLAPVDGRLHQLLYFSALEDDGFWISRNAIFEATPPSPTLEFRAIAFARPRKLRVQVDGRDVAELDVDTQWKVFRVEVPARRAVTLAFRSRTCTVAAKLGEGGDRRCLSVKLDGLPVQRTELFDLASDPGATRNLAAAGSGPLRSLLAELRRYPETPRARAGVTALSDEQVKNLKALGYLQ